MTVAVLAASGAAAIRAARPANWWLSDLSLIDLDGSCTSSPT
ncbi:MAG TPA: hypothetical protein VMU50_08525 [Polyangia bacterium]|nr:hypothetical protein [Polyangia bacterium]